MTHNPDQGEMVAIPDGEEGLRKKLRMIASLAAAGRYMNETAMAKNLSAIAEIVAAQPTKPAQVEQGELAELLRKAFPRPWEVDSERDTDGPDRHHYYKMFGPDGKVLFDSLNSDVAYLHDDYSEDENGPYSYVWDEQGRANFALIAYAVNNIERLATQSPAAELERRLAIADAFIEQETRWFDWEGDDDQQYRARMQACEARRKQWGDDDCDDRDGSCGECEYDMAEALEIPRSSARRRRAREALAQIRNGGGG